MNTMFDFKCDVPGCQGKCEMIWLGKDICEKHWKSHCDERSRFDLKRVFGIAGKKKETSGQATLHEYNA